MAHIDPVDPAVWEASAMRRALAARDITTVYRLLRDAGVSQRQLAALVGQSQSEVSEILAGRQVKQYDTLVRIADGLDVERGRRGSLTPPPTLRGMPVRQTSRR